MYTILDPARSLKLIDTRNNTFFKTIEILHMPNISARNFPPFTTFAPLFPPYHHWFLLACDRALRLWGFGFLPLIVIQNIVKQASVMIECDMILSGLFHEIMEEIMNGFNFLFDYPPVGP